MILVDDQSTDGSAVVIADLQKRHANLTVVAGRERPADWLGKPWAVKQGYQQATGSWLLFTDADCMYHPAVLRQAVGTMQAESLDMLSILPRPTARDYLKLWVSAAW